jgi:threonine/homoserine/homoserine lactone efflux protein
VPSSELLLPFFIASAAFACVPGPGMFYAAAQTIAHGRRAGWLSAIGFHLGGFVHITAAAFGMAVLLKTVPALYVIVKLLGAIYLVWLGISYFIGSNETSSAASAAGRKSSRKALRDSIMVEALNPKTALFYLAFLPQFTDMSAPLPVWAQVLVLGAVVNLMFSITDAACIELSEAMAKRLVMSRRTGRLAQRVGGSILIALGINLATSPH